VPHAENFLAQWPHSVGSDEYTLVAESVKSSHMGYFFRGRREDPVDGATEARFITPSHGEEDGVKSDTDFYLHPAMRAKEVTADVIKTVKADTSRLICCNIASPDMVGHLLPVRYEEAKAAYSAAADALVEHSINDVLTTVVRPDGAESAVGIPVFQARLFDIAPTMLELLGAENISTDGDTSAQPDRFMGRPLVAIG
jgi:bisphosphoglycerate-independent phosphoglycerate mutase (AlkP superfamily)